MKHLKVKIKKLEFVSETILKNIEFTLNKNDKISIVWPNWSGKTTFLKVLTWEISHFDWFIENVWNLSLWYLHQIYSDNEEKTVKEELKNAFKDILIIENTLKKIEKEMEKNPDDLDFITRYSDLLENFNNIGWYDIDNKIHGVANGMKILDLLDKKLIEVSWWERTKIALTKILLKSPDILFLDEPTNFIDIESVEWLESYLQNKWIGWYVIVSHDREFLDKTCNKTFELQPKKDITFYHTNYSNYVFERAKVENKKLENYKREQEYIKKQENLINRFRAGSRSGWAKSREKMIWKIKRLDKPYIPKKPKFYFKYLWFTPEKILNLKELFIWRKDPLFFIREAILYKWQRIWIVWWNWVWKSTLLKTIIWKIKPLDGLLIKWKSVKITYYSQMHEELDKNKNIRDNFYKFWLEFDEQYLISILKYYLFDKEDLDKKVSELSWGQTSKLLFAIIWQKESNLLVLDEPTNHLDYDTRESLEFALKKYDWSILFISHDRYFVNKLATHMWFIKDWELSISYWNYEDYKFKLENNLDMDFDLYDEEAQLNLVLTEKLWEKEAKRLKNKFGSKRK